MSSQGNNCLFGNQMKDKNNEGDDSSDLNSVSEGDSSDEENVLVIKPNKKGL